MDAVRMSSPVFVFQRYAARTTIWDGRRISIARLGARHRFAAAGIEEARAYSRFRAGRTWAVWRAQRDCRRPAAAGTVAARR